MMKMYKKYLSVFTLVAMLLGILCGFVFPSIVSNFSFIGSIYINVLKLMLVPVVFTGIASSIYDSQKLKKGIFLKTIIIFVLMFVFSFLISSLTILILDPAKGFAYEEIKWDNPLASFDLKSIFTNLIPKSFMNFITGKNLFVVIVLAYLFGFFSNKLKAEKLMKINNKVKDFIYKVVEYVMYFTPFAVFSLISNSVLIYGSDIIFTGFKYILTAFICAILVLIVVMIIPILLITKMNIFTFIKKISKIWVMTVTTCSSNATLPYTIKFCKEEFKIPEYITNVVVPLGTTVHMCGGAVSFSLLGLFCSKIYGIDISFTTYLMMLVYAILINMSAPGIPNGGVVIGATYLELLGIPLDFIGFYSGLYKVLDMIYTSLNVTDDITANVMVNALEKRNIKSSK